MRIAVIQMMYPKGHRRLDEEFIKILALEHELVLVDNGKYFSKELCNQTSCKRIKVVQPYSNRFDPLVRALIRLSLLIVLLTLKLKRINYDELLFLNIHNELYKMDRWLPKKKRILIHHNDLDALISNKKYQKCFETVKDNYYHVFLADYIGKHFCDEFGVNSKLVFTVHQPLVFKQGDNSSPKENLLIGIGNSMEEGFINDLIAIDKKSVEKLPNSIIVRSSQVSYMGNNLKVTTGFMPRADYESLYKRARISVVYYPSHYRYRYSGIIDDSLSQGLFVFCNESPCSRYFASVYPNSVRIIKDAQELWQLMHESLPSQPVDEKKLFYNRHSLDYVKNQFDDLINA